MKKRNILAIIVEGRFVLDINNESNYIIISSKEPDEEQIEIGQWLQTVSYTHLTLPTTD